MGKQGSFLKRLTDVVISVLLLIPSFPVLLIAAIAIKIESKGPVFFTQKRSGVNGVEFTIYKLRTMVQGSENGEVWTQKNDKRITAVGRLLRLTSIDELPQLINVLIGDMSIIGPRPEVPSVVVNYTPAQQKVLKYKPGITGYSQVNGRAAIELNKKLMMDIEYSERETFFTDLKILLKTPLVVISNDGNIM